MPSTLDEEDTRRELHQLIDVDKGAAIHAVSLPKKWSMKKQVRFMINFLEVQVVAKKNGTHRIKHRVVNASGGVKPGEGMKLLKVLSTVILPVSRRTTAIGSICANSKAVMGLSPSGKLRSFFVGQVVVLKNDDNKFKEN
jgi:acetyl-CoA carboxylase carboxyltransferase component